MAVIPGSVRVGGFIAPSDSTDTYATQSEEWGRGGWRTVADITARNAITADRRKIGMLVRVLDAGSGTEKFYTLVGGIADINWTEQNFGGGTGNIDVDKNGTLVGTRPEINLIEGANVTLTVADNVGADRVDITVAATGSAPANMARVSTAAVTYYVRSDGNDSNDGLASDSGHSLLTIQAAVNKLPDIVNHKMVVDIGAGTFAGFLLQNKQMGLWQGLAITDRTIVIQGAGYVAATLASGNMTGTVEAGTTRTIDDTTGAGWTVHDLRGRILYVNSTYYVIRDNTTTQLEIVGEHGSSMSGVYAIKDYATVIQEAVGSSISGAYAGVRVINCSGSRSVYATVYLNNFQVKITSATQGTLGYGLFILNSDIWVSYVGVDNVNNTTGGAAGFFGNVGDCRVENSSFGRSAGEAILFQNVGYLRTFSTTVVYAASYGVNFLNAQSIITSTNVYADSNTASGFAVQGGGFFKAGSWFAKSNASGVGLWVSYNTNYMGITGGIFDGNKYGILLGHNLPDSANYSYETGVVSFRAYGSVIVQNSVNAGVCAENGVRARFTSLVGTGNGTYGLIARRGAHVTVTSGTTVTGTSGDILFNGTAATYATHFAADGDSLTDPTDGTSLIRTDAA